MRKVAAMVLALSVSLMLATVPIARANDPQFMILDGAEHKSPEYISFFGTFSKALIELLTKVDGQRLAPDHWIILLSPILSTTGETLVTIIAVHEKKSELPILIAVLSERSSEATVRTAAKSTQRLLIEAATQQQQREESPQQMGERKWQ
jgi:hypothetical protein